jgi:hypothetical protein
VDGCSVFGKPITGNSMPSRGNFFFSNNKGSAINENMGLRKEKNTEWQECENNSHVGMEVTTSTPYSMGSNAQAESVEPVSNNPVLKTEEGRAKSGKVGTKWKRCARGRPSLSTQITDWDRGNKKEKLLVMVEMSTKANGEGKQTRIMNWN